MTSVSAGHIIHVLTPTQPVGSGRPQRESNPGHPHRFLCSASNASAAFLLRWKYPTTFLVFSLIASNLPLCKQYLVQFDLACAVGMQHFAFGAEQRKEIETGEHFSQRRKMKNIHRWKTLHSTGLLMVQRNSYKNLKRGGTPRTTCSRDFPISTSLRIEY